MWIGCLGVIGDRHWPSVKDITGFIGKLRGDEKKTDVDCPTLVSPLSSVEPNSRPVPDPKRSFLQLKVIEQIESGKLDPQDLDKNFQVEKKSLEPNNLLQLEFEHISPGKLGPQDLDKKLQVRQKSLEPNNGNGGIKLDSRRSINPMRSQQHLLRFSNPT